MSELNANLNPAMNLNGSLTDASALAGSLNLDDNITGSLTSEHVLNGSLIPTSTMSGLLGVYGEGGTSDYNELENKPSINNVTLQGNKTTDDLGLFSGDYNDLTNKPTIPAAQVNSDWNAVSGVAEILNKPTIPDELNDMSDVDVSHNPLNTADLLTYSAALSKWINCPLDAIEIPHNYSLGNVLQVTTNIIPSSCILGVAPLSYNKLIDKPTLATVATTGSYNDLIDKPTIGGLIPYRDVETQIGTWLDGTTPVYQKYIDLGSTKTLAPNTNVNLAPLPGDILLLGGGCIRIDTSYTGYFPYIQLVANGTYLQGNNIRSTSVGINAVLIQYVYRS